MHPVGWVLFWILAPMLAIPSNIAFWVMSTKRWRLPTEQPLFTSVTFGAIGWAAFLVGVIVLAPFIRNPDPAASLLLGVGGVALWLLLPAGLVIRARRRRWSRFPGLSAAAWAFLDREEESLQGSSRTKHRRSSSPDGVFVSYRREDTQQFAGRLTDRLHATQGKVRVFTDIDSIAPGLDFVEEIERAIEASRVMLVVIGDKWLTVRDPHGQRRLDDPQDFVRLEVEAGLRHDLRVIPVLVDGAVMPRSTELPPSLSGLARRSAVEVRYETFGQDVSRLVAAVNLVLGKK